MRGQYVRYIHEPDKKLLVISEPYEYGEGGQMVVTCRTCEKARSKEVTALYDIRALRPWTKGKE